MKLMKHIMIALVLCAIPAAAVGQTVSCDDCSHVASVYMGEGGVIATADDGADMVAWVASCGGVTRSGKLTPSADGVVAALWTGDLACMAEKGSFEIGPVKDGGWFWITDADNSAVGGLVAKDVLKNDAATITSAGSGVTMTAGKGAVFLKEAASGRVGILPNILPEPPVKPLRKCGADDKGSVGKVANATADQPNARYTRRTSKCALGDGGTQIIATVEDSLTGKIRRIPDKGTIVRPAGTGTTDVFVDLWGNGTGHFTTSATGHAQLGNPAVAMTDLRGYARLAGVTYAAKLGSGPRGSDLQPGTANGGVTMSPPSESLVVLDIAADAAYCNAAANPPVNHSATVSVTAYMADAGRAAQTTPSLKRATTGTPVGKVASTSFMIVCPGSASSHQGQELVPENPFPVE